MDKKNVLKRALVALIGLIFCGLGVGLFLYSGLGVDPASVFELGIANVCHISYGTSSALINVVILVIVFFIDRKYINISSLIAIVGIGYTADFTSMFLDYLNLGELNLFIKCLMILVGLFIMGIGIATYIRADLGVGAIDLVSEIISDKTHFQYRLIRIVIDVTFVVVGFILGGTVGVGTIVAAFLTGPTVQLVRPGVFKVVDKFIGRKSENGEGKNAGKEESNT